MMQRANNGRGQRWRDGRKKQLRMRRGANGGFSAFSALTMCCARNSMRSSGAGSVGQMRTADREHRRSGNARAARATAERSARYALSGGGIRSAAFCLGVLQALAEKRMLRQFDYLSTVSGGGFIGGWLQVLIRELGGVSSAEERDSQPAAGSVAAVAGLHQLSDAADRAAFHRYLGRNRAVSAQPADQLGGIRAAVPADRADPDRSIEPRSGYAVTSSG